MSKSKQKGTSWETAIVRYLEEQGISASRKVLAGSNDQGDIDMPLGIVVEAKNERAMTLSSYVDEANIEARNTKEGWIGVAWHHRKGKSSPGDAYVTMDGASFVKLVKELMYTIG
jgi:hypothetical protein